MKKIIFIIALMIGLSMSITANAENIKAESKQHIEFTDTTTNHTYEIKDTKYPIFVSRTGKYYIWKISSKTNKKYKYYLPKAIQQRVQELNKQ